MGGDCVLCIVVILCGKQLYCGCINATRRWCSFSCLAKHSIGVEIGAPRRLRQTCVERLNVERNVGERKAMSYGRPSRNLLWASPAQRRFWLCKGTSTRKHRGVHGVDTLWKQYSIFIRHFQIYKGFGACPFGRSNLINLGRGFALPAFTRNRRQGNTQGSWPGPGFQPFPSLSRLIGRFTPAPTLR